MSSDSVRMHLPPALHQHDDPVEHPALSSIPPGDRVHPGDGCAAATGRLWREGDRVMFQPAAGGEAAAVRVVWARPLSGRGGPVSLLMAGKKREVAYLPTLDCLDPASRTIALEELALGAVLPVITVIHQVRPRFGNYYWDVETSMGRKKFLLSSPESNSYRPMPGVVIIKDVSGNLYEIASVDGLDRNSRREMERAL